MAANVRSVVLVIIATIFTTAAQLLFKIGSSDQTFAILSFPINLTVIGGFVAYGIAALLFLFALRNGELSVLYPLWSLSFVWIFLVSLAVLGETVVLANWIGIALIITGVSLIGREAEHA